MSKHSASSKPLLSTQTLILLCLGWAIFSLLFFLLFSTPPSGGERPLWYMRGITFLEMGAFLGAAILCFRNWRSHRIVSGRGVWLAIGLGMLSYFLGNALFGLWGRWGLDPAVSLGDFFYILAYVFLGWGMLQAVLPRRLHLEPAKWAIIIGVGVLGIAIAFFVNYYASPGESAVNGESNPNVEQIAFAPGDSTAQVPEVNPPAPDGTPVLIPALLDETCAPEAEAASSAPEWAIKLDQWLEPLAPYVTLLYMIGDCILVTIAASLLVAFWEGRFSESWKLIAVAAFCLYIADMIFFYIVNNPNIEYTEGDVWEVFWTFSAVYFALGAVVEYGISTRSRRTARRKRG